MKFLLFTIIVFILGGCDGYYKSDKNPFDTSKLSCESDYKRYDKSLVPPESFGKIGFVSTIDEYPRGTIGDIGGVSSRHMQVTLNYESLCKSAKINKMLLQVNNGDDKKMLLDVDVPLSFSGRYTLDINPNKDNDSRCFYRDESSYSFYSWARDEDGNTFFANTKNKFLSLDVKSYIRDFTITPEDDHIYIRYNLRMTPKNISFMVYAAGQHTGTVYVAEIKKSKKLKSADSERIYYKNYAIFDKTKKFTIEIQALESLSLCNIPTHKVFVDKLITLRPTAIVSIEDNATHILGVKLSYRKNYQSNVTDGFLTIDGVGNTVDPKGFYEFILEKSHIIDSVPVKYYVVNSRGVSSPTVTSYMRK